MSLSPISVADPATKALAATKGDVFDQLWHSEISPKLDAPEERMRVLLYMEGICGRPIELLDD